MEGSVHVLLVRVYYEDTDALGLVYYANYLKYMERGRTDMLRLLGVGRHDPVAGDAEGLFVVRHCSIDFLGPARLDDILEIRTSVAGLGGAVLDLDQAVRRDGIDLVTGRVKAACIDKSGKARRISPKIRQKLQHLCVTR
jgi:acyl-CoA thioester hydrolase